MATTHVGASQATQNASVASSTGLSLTRTAGAIGNLLVVFAATSDVSQPITISDTQGNTWNVCNADFNDATNTTRSASWYALAKNTASTTVTVKSAGAGSAFWTHSLDEWTNAAGSLTLGPVNKSAAGATGTNITGTAITMTADGALVVSFLVDNATAVGNLDGSAATKGSDDTVNDWTEYRILVGRSGVSVTAAWTNTGAYEYFIAAFNPPTTTGSAPSPHATRPFPFKPSSATLRGF